jgi:hypothetical protein
VAHSAVLGGVLDAVEKEEEEVLDLIAAWLLVSGSSLHFLQGLVATLFAFETLCENVLHQ